MLLEIISRIFSWKVFPFLAYLIQNREGKHDVYYYYTCNHYAIEIFNFYQFKNEWIHFYLLYIYCAYDMNLYYSEIYKIRIISTYNNNNINFKYFYDKLKILL